MVVVYFSVILLRRRLRLLLHLLNVVVGEAEMAVFISGRNKTEGFLNTDETMVWCRNFCCRIQLEFFTN